MIRYSLCLMVLNWLFKTKIIFSFCIKYQNCFLSIYEIWIFLFSELFIKTNIYIGHEEFAEFRTDLNASSSQNISIEQSYKFEITPDRVRNMFILIQIFEKHLMGNISLHRTVIGPYMRPNMKSKKQSCWEKAILCPGEEVSCLCGLYRWYLVVFSIQFNCGIVWLGVFLFISFRFTYVFMDLIIFLSY